MVSQFVKRCSIKTFNFKVGAKLIVVFTVLTHLWKCRLYAVKIPYPSSPCQVPIVSDSVCQSAMSQFNLAVDSTLVCAGGEGKGPCQVH